MLKKEEIKKILSNNYPIFGYMPKGFTDPQFAINLSQNGAIGLIDFEGFDADQKLKCLQTMNSKLKSSELWGIRVISKNIFANLPENVHIPLLIVGYHPNKQEIKEMRSFSTIIISEVLYLEEAQENTDWADFFLVKGNEAGGLVGTKNTFIQMQEFEKAGLSYIIQGGFGVFNVASALIGGALGIVFESQLYLLQESPLSKNFKDYIKTLEENDFFIASENSGLNFRLTGKLANKTIRNIKKNQDPVFKKRMEWKEKEEFRNKIYSLAGFGHEKQSLPQFFADEAPKHAWLPTDQGICFAKYIADQFIDIPRFLKGINILTQKQISIISVNWPFEKNSKFAQSLNIKYPIVQGPMANISDNVEFAIEVAKKGALPVFAMGGLMGPQAEELLATASKKFPPELSFGCGIIGLEAVKKRRADHLISISKHHPAVTLVAAGTTDLGLQVKELGNKVLIHTPALSMFKDALKKGLEYPILEGNECGGHIGILSSFILWENVLEYLDINRTSFASNEEKIKLIFAGGINNAYSTGMIAAMIGNHLDIINPGLQIGSAYLLTQEITKTKALSQVYQELLLNHNSTRVIGATVNTRARLIPSNFANRTVEKELDRIQKSIPISERKNLFEKDNLGALQIASKAEIWNPKHVEGSGSTQFVPVETEKQIDMGCFMAGEDISVQSSIRSIADLHYDISIDAFTLVKNRGLEFLRELTLKNEEKSLIQEQFEEEITLKPKLISSSMVAIIGIGCIFPDANNVEEFWNNILSKKYSITEVPKERWDPEIYFDPDRSVPDKSYTKIGGFIKNFKFKSVKYRIPPKMAAQMDDVQKWALEAAKETLLDAGYPIDGKKRLPFGVIVGNALGGENQRHNNKRIMFNEIEYRIKNEHVFDGFSTKHKDQIIKNLKQSMLHGILEINEDTMPGELSNIISGRIANVFNLTGKNMTTDAACASSLAALDTAVKGLLTRDYDAVLTGGADRSMDPAPFIKFCKIGALSADESCPFDAKADGFVMGEGAGFVMLKRLDDAIRDKNKIYAIIKGIGASADGKGKGITAPNPKGQKEAFERAYKSAQIDPSKIQYVECHGTSTIAGDAAELTILNEIFAKNKRKSPLAVGSVKSQIGHLKSAAGIASIIKTSLALSHKILPPSINFNIPNPKIDWSKAPFYVNKDPIPWEVSENYPRRAGISAFGFGGTNYHVVMEEYKPGNYYMNSQSNAGEVLTSQIGPHSQSQSTSASLDQDPRLSFLFSGQGSQYLGMGKELYKKIPTIKNILDQANSICKSFGKFNMLNILFGSPDLSLEENKSKIIQTQYTQPILYSLEVALFTYYQENNLIPGMVAGHSLGEFTALTCANVINFEDGLKAVILRGKAMANTSKGNSGTMAAIFTTGIVVEDMIQKLNNGYITISNYNSPSQTVISGEESAINQAIEVFTKAGITAKKINVSAAFHSRLVAHAQDAVKPFLEGIEFKTPEIPVYSNVSGKMYPSSPEKIKQLLIKQITSPVHWVEEISNMYQDGGRIFIEVGPKKTLFYFAKDILKSYKDTEISYSFSPKSQEVSQIEKIIKKYNKKTQPNTDIGKKTNLNISKKGQRFGTQGTAFSVLGETPILKDLSKQPHFEEYLRDQSEFLGTLLNQGFKQYQAKYQPALEKQKQIEKFDFNTEPIGITGVGIGLPGKNRNVFDDQNVIDVLHGINLIEPIDIDLQKETLKKNIVRLEKTADGNASFKPIEDISQVIHLAGQLGHFNPTEDFKLEPKYLNALDTTFQLAIGAGLEALKDAGIPLVRSQIKTSTGKILQGDWALPKELQEETGVIFASAFPGYNNLIEDITTHLTQEFKTESYQNIKRFYESLITSVSDEKSRKNLETWFEENKSQLFDEKIEVKEFNRAFLFRILAMGHSQFAQLIKAKGPNAYNNTACASTTQAIGMAGDWIRLGRCKRVIVIAADDVTDKRVLPWFAAGFISGGAGTTEEKWEEAVLPFGEGRNGLIMGSAASGLVIESETAYNHRGVKPIVDYLGSHFCNSAFHGSRLDRNHIPREVKKFINKMEKRYSISQDDLVTNGMFVSHETYTPARGGSAEAELDALIKVFGEDAYKMLIINTKGYTGHPMGAGIEEVVAIKSMETGIIPPIANYKHLDPEFSKFNFAMGKNERKKYAMRFAAGFGSQMAVVLLRLNTYTDRFANKEYDNWLNSINGTRNGLFKDGRILKIKTQKKLPKQLVQKPIVSKSIEVELKQIIANKTGYDIADIESEYDLEEDLGVDTVKQAEIFGEVREHWNLKENQNMNLADFRNVSDIVKMIEQHTGNFNITDPSKNQAMSQPISQNSVPIQSASASQSSVDEIKQIIANKTGYEIEDIENDFDLEEDLGIDTVKQAEIFGEIRERWSLQENDGTSLADFRTINDIVKSIGANHDHSLRQELLTVKPNNSTEFEIKQIVANKTGYEIEDIENDFDLEEDLGIDTVKQAEIFGEIRERWNLQENDGTSLADFRTINDILKTVQQNNGESLKAYSVENKSEITSNSEGNDSIEHVIKQVISEKTGYEKGDIENDFDLEEDLGVDTVKQVEIFGLLREKFHLKDSDNSGLANLRTLNQIADFIRNSQIQHSSKNDSKKEDENIETRKSSEIDNNSNKNVTQEENKDNISTSMVQPVKIQNLAFSDEKWQLKNNNILLIDLGSKLANEMKNKFQIQDLKPHLFKLEQISLKNENKFGSTVLILPDCELNTKSHSDAALIFDRLFKLFKEIDISSLENIVILSPEEYFGWESKANPISGAISGFIKTLGKEYGIPIKHIYGNYPEQIYQELSNWDDFEEIAFKNKNRYTLVKKEVNLSIPNTQNSKIDDISSDEILLATGGARGITFACLDNLTDKVQPTVVLLGRTNLSEKVEDLISLTSEDLVIKRDSMINELKKENKKVTPVMIKKNWRKYLNKIEMAKNIHKLRTKGLNVYYYSVDVMNSEKIKQTLQTIQANLKKPVSLVIHGAGLEESKGFEKKSLSSAQIIVGVKLQGALNIWNNISHKNLKLFVNFSSIAGRYGNQGQVDYAYANGFLSRWAWQTSQDKIPMLAIDWSAWADVGMATKGSILQILKSAGIDPIPLKTGVKIFSELVLNGFSKEFIVAGKLGTFENLPSIKEIVNHRKFPMITTIEHNANKFVGKKVLNTKFDKFLLDHQIQNIPVLPGVMGLEIFAEFYKYRYSTTMKEIDDVQFQKVVRVPKDKPVEVQIDFDSGNNQVSLISKSYPTAMKGKAVIKSHFSAKYNIHHSSIQKTKQFLKENESPKIIETIVPLLSKEQIYELFFHGPSFQMLDHVIELETDHIISKVEFPHLSLFNMNKEEYKTQIDPLAIESGLQTAGLHDLVLNSNFSLPAMIKKVSIFNENEPRYVRANLIKKDERFSYFNVKILDKNQEIIVYLDTLAMIHTRMGVDISDSLKQYLLTLQEYARLKDLNLKSVRNLEIIPIDMVQSQIQDNPEFVKKILSPKELDNMQRFKHDRRKTEYIAGIISVKQCLMKLNQNSDNQKRVEVRKEPKGQPYLAYQNSGKRMKKNISISHSHDFAIAILGDKQIGIDLEKIEPRSKAFYNEAFNETENKAIAEDDKIGTLYWTAKEAFSKAIGEGMHMNLHDIEISYNKDLKEFEVSLQKQLKTLTNGIEKIQIFSETTDKFVVSICEI